MKFLITGTGRCGTTYCQAMLRVCGVNCGHQDVFRHEHTLAKSWDWGDFAGDSSFEAVPLLPLIREREPDTKIILIKRDKEKVCASWLRLGLFGDNMATSYEMFSKVLDQYFPQVMEQATPLERAQLYYDVWNDAAAKYADVTYEIETLDPLELFKEIGYEHMYDHVLVRAIKKDTNRPEDRV